MNKLHLTFTLIISGIIFHSYSMNTQPLKQTCLEIVPYKTTAEILKTEANVEHHLYEFLSTQSNVITNLIEQRDAYQKEIDRLENIPEININPIIYFMYIDSERYKQHSLNQQCWDLLDAYRHQLMRYNKLCLTNHNQTELVQKTNGLSNTFVRQTINVLTFIIDNTLCTEEWFTQLDTNKEFMDLFWKEFYDSIEHLPEKEQENKIYKKWKAHYELEKYNKNFSFMPKGRQEYLSKQLQTLLSKEYDITPEQADQLRKNIENGFSRPIDQQDKTELFNQLNRITQEKEYIKRQLLLYQPKTQAGMFLNKVSQRLITPIKLIGFNPDVIKNEKSTQPNEQKPKKNVPQWSWLRILMSSVVITLPATITITLPVIILLPYTIFALTKLFPWILSDSTLAIKNAIFWILPQ